MKRRVLVYGGLVLGLLVLILLVRADDAQHQHRRHALTRLWCRGGAPIVLVAWCVAERKFDNAPCAPQPRRFLPWLDWPAESRGLINQEGLICVGTESSDNLVVTSFIRPKVLDARWFYVTPQPSVGASPWFLVVAMDSEFLVYGDSQSDSGLVMESHRTPPYRIAPLEIIRHICARREATSR